MFKKIRWGMIGGGIGSMIGAIHRHAANLDNSYELIGGVFSNDHKKSLRLGEKLGLKPRRIYPNYIAMLNEEKKYPKDERIEVITVATPNDSHFKIAKAIIEEGFHLIMDKPLATSIKHAKILASRTSDKKIMTCITYVYTGYPMIKEARVLINSGKLGSVRKVIVEFSQGWLSTYQEGKHQKQAHWRMDPGRGPAGTIVDLGSHLFHLIEYVTNLKVNAICADMRTTVNTRLLDDDNAVLLRFENGASGILLASQIAAGEDSRINLRVYGDKGSLEWNNTDANKLLVKWLDKPMQVYALGNNNKYLSRLALYHCRTPAGHAEGFIEAFANHYRNFASAVRSKKDNVAHELWYDYPKIEEAVRGVAFFEAVITSAKSAEKWLKFGPTP